MDTLTIAAYYSILFLLCAYGIHRSYLVYLLWRNEDQPPADPADVESNDLPSVVVQLPVFNEANVIERLVRTTAKLEYPRDRLHIQILDDSTDDTTAIAERLVAELSAEGVPIELIHRTNRQGFKAGALAEGLEACDAELVAIFDADFIPQPSFLLETVGPFSDKAVGMVQACWGHLNRSTSLLTEIQATLLDAHFLIEHHARFASGRFFNFNGTAGVWRRSAIDEAGGWQGDTLTEDLDLSYRAQLAGWQFVFLPHVKVPAELPENITAFKSQQHRWAKGSIQTARKLLPTIMRASVPFRVKSEAFFHLTSNIAYPLMVLLALLLLPNLVTRYELGWSLRWIVAADAAVILGATGSLALFYFEATRRALGNGWPAVLRLPAIMSLGIGISAANSVAVLQGLFASVGTFVRTPKTGAGLPVPRPIRSYRKASGWAQWIELCFAFHCTGAVIAAFAFDLWGSIPFLILFPAGYLGVSLGSFNITSRRRSSS